MFEDTHFLVERGVFDPVAHLSGMVFARWLVDQNFANQRVLELGTGCGLLAYTLSRTAASVVATDVDPRAVACASANLRATTIDLRCGDLFAPVTTEHFDTLVANPPYEVGRSRRPTLRSPDFLERFAEGWTDVADSLIVAFPTDSIDLFDEFGLDLELEVRLSTAGRELGIFRSVARDRTSGRPG